MPRGARAPRLYAALDSFSTTLDGTPVNISKGQLVDEHDPILKGKRRQLFVLYSPRIRDYPGRVEQATAAPGERRA